MSDLEAVEKETTQVMIKGSLWFKCGTFECYEREVQVEYTGQTPLVIPCGKCGKSYRLKLTVKPVSR